MSGRVHYAKGDTGLLVLFIIWECDEDAIRYELLEGGVAKYNSCFACYPFLV